MRLPRRRSLSRIGLLQRVLFLLPVLPPPVAQAAIFVAAEGPATQAAASGAAVLRVAQAAAPGDRLKLVMLLLRVLVPLL